MRCPCIYLASSKLEMERLKLVPLERKHKEAYGVLHKELLGSPPTDKWFEEALVDEYAETYVLVNESGEVLATGCICKGIYADDYWLDYIVVRSDMRKKGVGRLLIDALINKVKEKGGTHVRLISVSSAAPFYLAVGFKQERHFMQMFIELHCVVCAAAQPEARWVQLVLRL